MALMRELRPCGSVTAEHCVRKTTGGGRREFFLKTLYLQTHRHIHTHSENYTLTLISTHHSHNTHTDTNIHVSTYTYKHLHTFSQPHTNFHISTQTVHILVLTHRHAYLHAFIRLLPQSPVSQSLSSSRREQEGPWFPLSPFSKFLAYRWPQCL